MIIKVFISRVVVIIMNVLGISNKISKFFKFVIFILNKIHTNIWFYCINHVFDVRFFYF